MGHKNLRRNQVFVLGKGRGVCGGYTLIESHLSYGCPRACWKTATRYIVHSCNTTKRKKLLHLRIYNENLHKIPHISQKYVLNCLSKPFCLLRSSEEGSGASTQPESNGSENSTTKQIKGPVLFQKPFYTCFIKTLRKSRAFYFHQLLLSKVASQSFKIGFEESNSKFLIFYVNFHRHL